MRLVLSSFRGVLASAESEGAVVQQMRAAFQSEALSCMEMVTRCLPLDSAVDQMAVQFLKARLPPIAVTPRAGEL